MSTTGKDHGDFITKLRSPADEAGITYRVEHLRHWVNPIYEAPFEERLADLKKTIEQVESLLPHPAMLRPVDAMENNEVKLGEFALGNWIVRPRFK